MDKRKRAGNLRERVSALMNSDRERSWDAREIATALGDTVRRVANELTHQRALGLIFREPVKERVGDACRPLFRYRAHADLFDPADLLRAVSRMSADGPFRHSIQGEQR